MGMNHVGSYDDPTTCYNCRQTIATAPPECPAMHPNQIVEQSEKEITDREARILEAYGPLEMTRIITTMVDELQWIAAFADIRSQDESKVFARVNRGALRTIRDRATAATIPPDSHP